MWVFAHRVILAKYEYKSFVDKSAQVTSLLGPSRSAPRKPSPALPTRSQTAPVVSSPRDTPSPAPPPLPAKTPTIYSSLGSSGSPAPSSLQAPLPPVPPVSLPSSQLQPVQQAAQVQPQQASISSHPALRDLSAFQSPVPASNSTLPLQYLSPNPIASMQSTQPMSIPNSSGNTFLTTSSPYGTLSASPHPSFSSSPGQITGISPGTMNMGLNYSTGLSSGMGTPGLNAFQSSQSPFGGPAPMYTPTAAPVQSPFAPQPLQSGAMGGLNQLSQPSFLPYSSSPSNQPFGQATTPQPSGPSPMYQTQSLPPQPALQHSTFQAQMMPQQQQQQQNILGYQSPMNSMLQQQQQQQIPMMSTPQFTMSGAQSPMPFGQQGFSSGPAFGMGTPGYPGQQWGGM